MPKAKARTQVRKRRSLPDQPGAVPLAPLAPPPPTALTVVPNPYLPVTAVKQSATFQFFRETMWSIVPEAERMDELQAKFKSCSWVYIAVTRIAQSAAQVPALIKRADREGKPNSIVRGRDNGLRQLLDQPNPFQSWYDFVEEAFVSWLLTGNVFTELVTENGLATDRPTELYVLNPARIRIIPGPKQVAGYVYEVNGKQFPFLPEEISHTKFPHPQNDWYGLSPLTSARLSIEVDKAAAEWNRNFLLQGSWPAGVIESAHEPGQQELRRLRREIKSSLQTGSRQAGRLMLLTGGLKFNKIAVLPKDADWINGRRMSRDDILAIYGVPFAVAGLFSTEQTTARSAGVVQQVKNFYLFTIFPLLKKFYAGLTRDLARRFHPEFVVAPDLRAVPALQEDVDQELTRAMTFSTLVAAGWSPNTALTELYPHVQPFPWGEVAWLNSAMVPIAGPAATAPEPTEDPPRMVAPWQTTAWQRILSRRRRLAREMPDTVE